MFTQTNRVRHATLTYTYIIQGNLLTGARNYELALKDLSDKGPSVQLATLYNKLGWNVFKQGDLMKAIR